MKKNILRGIVFIFISVISMNVHAQSQRRVEKTVQRQKEKLEKDKQEKKKQNEKEMEAIKKAHFEMQTKDVQKRMKKNKRKSKRVNENKKQFFLKRWFSKR